MPAPTRSNRPLVGSGAPLVSQPPEAHLLPVVAKLAPVVRFNVFVPDAGVVNDALSIVIDAVPSFFAKTAENMYVVLAAAA